MTKPSARPASEEIEAFTHDAFSKTLPPGVAYGFFGRKGGLSEGVFQGLNCGQGSNDVPETVAKNRSLVAAKIGITPENLLSLYQVHGNACMTVETPWLPKDRPNADGMVTDRPGLGLGILIADCAPVLFHGVKPDGSPVIGAAHAGWKGAVSGVLEQTAKTMIERGADPQTLSACVGPCIGPQSYEVSADFIKPFLEHDAGAQRFFRAAQKPGHLMFDLPAYALWRLQKAGIRSAFDLGRDTFADEANFYSYRRTTHRKEADYGRQIAVIALTL